MLGALCLERRAWWEGLGGQFLRGSCGEGSIGLRDTNCANGSIEITVRDGGCFKFVERVVCR